MSDIAPPRISVVIPIFGNEGDLSRLVKALQGQSLPPYEILLVDGSPQPVESAPPGTRLIRSRAGSRIGEDYDVGAKAATGDYILCMQQDCLPADSMALARIFRELTPSRVSVVARVRLPEDYFRRYSFWGQVLMARWLGSVRQGVSGKFDLHRRDVFSSVGWMETWHLHAGEDIDLCMRLMQYGEVLVSDVEVIHYHHQRMNTSAWDLLRRQYLLAQSFGALFRKYGFALRRVPYASHWSHHLAKWLYPLVPLLVVAPLPMAVVLFVGSNLCNFEAWKVKSWRKPVLLLFNPCLFVSGFVGMLSGLCQRSIARQPRNPQRPLHQSV